MPNSYSLRVVPPVRDNGNAAIVVAESEELEARKFLENVKNSMPKLKRSPFPIHCPVYSTYHRGSVSGLYEAVVGKPYLSDMVTDSVSLCIETELESIISVLACENVVEQLLWKVIFDNLSATPSATQAFMLPETHKQECTIAVFKLLVPDMFKNFSMQEVRSIVDERS
ncbi:hypothetical protein KY290_020925 [Solanum tuberosum]|uniref:Uncharacterized protein n=1 Tax=Solanum tuberosum TaxID=4113 RepID=A0ABQ7V219_SOLTU|nr:hypothetical protein KY289_020088 [Solanum tuberosum]KAH0692039.1 hypothetical protein KY285_019136 [Solanum tuberosum]KAH0757432.1 hypothetical protein KY290_020925 [Solanum tuberosum]